MIKSKRDLILLIGIFVLFLGCFLPSIKIASENISFIKDNGIIMIVLVLIMLVLYGLDKKDFIFIPSCISVRIIVGFIISNSVRLKEITELYNCYADYKFGLIVMLAGNGLILISMIIRLVNLKVLKNAILCFCSFFKRVFSYVKQGFLLVILFFKNLILRIGSILLNLKNNKFLSKETTTDGKIHYNKIVVRCSNKDVKSKFSLKNKIRDFILKLKLKSFFHKKLSISKFKNDEIVEKSNCQNKVVLQRIFVIDIKRWTRNKVCCLNCGASISSNSEYCFLCDCKMKINKKEKLS